MPPPVQAATLLVMTSQAREAEHLIATLRNAGLLVHGVYDTDVDRLGELVERGACDLILCCSDDPSVDLQAVLDRLGRLVAEVPLILIADRHADGQARVKALRLGARDLIARDDAEHLRLAVGRELADLRTRRQVTRLARRLQQCERQTRELIETTAAAMAFIREGVHVHANPAYWRLFRYTSAHDLHGVPFLDMIDADQRQTVGDYLRGPPPGEQATDQSHNQWGLTEFPTLCIRADSSRFPCGLIAARSEIDGEPCLRLTLRDLSPPGGWAPAPPAQGSGYAAFVATIAAALAGARPTAEPFAILCIRAPSLVRDLGLGAGLAMIDSLAAPLGRICQGLGEVIRIGDDSFGLIAPGLDDAGATLLAERIRTEVRLPRTGSIRQDPAPDCRLGYVICGDPGAGAAELLDAAYRACQGDGEVTRERQARTRRLAAPATRDGQSAEPVVTGMTAKIANALDSDRFRLVYQPVVSLMGDRQENYSVLTRLLDEAEHLLEAKEFIRPAIRSGLIERIDRWAIREAIQTLSKHRRAGYPLNFFIHLAEDSLRDPETIIWICDCLREFDVRGSWLTFVIQEALVDGNLANLSRVVESLKTIKCRVAINRFGAAEHPQTLLQRLPLDFVLLLPDYTQGLAGNSERQRGLLALAKLAREFNVKSVATCVEDAPALSILWTAGVDYVQGNLLQRPSPTLEILT